MRKCPNSSYSKYSRILKFGWDCEIWSQLWNFVNPHQFGLKGSDWIHNNELLVRLRTSLGLPSVVVDKPIMVMPSIWEHLVPQPLIFGGRETAAADDLHCKRGFHGCVTSLYWNHDWIRTDVNSFIHSFVYLILLHSYATFCYNTYFIMGSLEPDMTSSQINDTFLEIVESAWSQ